MHDTIEHSIVPTPIASNHLQRGEVIVEKNGQGEVTVLHFDGEVLRKARNNDELQKLAQDHLASYGPGRYTCSPELAVRAEFDGH